MPATPPGSDAVLVRFGDISTKSPRVRRMMEDTLVANLEWTLADAGVEARIEHEWARPIVVPDRPSAVDAVAEVAARTLGVVSTSPCRRVVPERAAILEAIAEVAEAGLIEGRFAVRVRRADKSLPFTSTELEREGGSAVFDAVADPGSVEVDLDDPTVTVHVEARPEAAYVFTRVVDGPGGLPVGSQAACVALVSGGIDSPVAAYRVMRRGCPVVPVYIDLGPYSGPDHQARALESIARLRPAAATAARPAHLVPGGEFVTDLVEHVDSGRMLVLRRFMFRVADRIAEAVGASGIVTGEAIGQKSSQTASNLYATSVAATRPIHRPLLALDKNEITSMARSIGTYRSATIDAGCPSIAPGQVATRATPEEVDALEFDDVASRVADAVAAASEVDLETIESYRPTADPPTA